MHKRSQTATEYLIILAVVIVIALILITILGGFPSFGGDAAKRSSDAHLKSLYVAVPSHVITGNGTRIEIQNNQPETIQIQNITINGLACNNSNPMLPLILGSGESKAIFCPTISANAGSRYEFPISILYTSSHNSLNEEIGSLMGIVGHGSVGTAIDPVNGACGSAHEGTYAIDPPVTSRCASGSVSNFSSIGSGWTWICLGLNDGEDSNECSAIFDESAETIFGCIDSNANNYDPLATDDDGSCTYDTSWCDPEWGVILPFNEDLCWQRHVSGDIRTWQDSVDYCEGLTLGGLAWVLPEGDEIGGTASNVPTPGSLLYWSNEVRGLPQFWENGKNIGTWLNENWGFTGFTNAWYWSNTLIFHNAAWIVVFFIGDVGFTGIGVGELAVCVSQNT